MVGDKEAAAWMVGKVAFCSKECAERSKGRGKAHPIAQEEFERLRERGDIGHACNRDGCDELLPGV